MSKHVVLYEDNGFGKMEKAEWIDGVVVDEGGEQGQSSVGEGFWNNVWSFFHANGSVVGGNEWEESYRKNPVRDNGRVSHDGINWTFENPSNASEFGQSLDFEIVSDSQGGVPMFCGHNE